VLLLPCAKTMTAALIPIDSVAVIRIIAKIAIRNVILNSFVEMILSILILFFNKLQ